MDELKTVICPNCQTVNPIQSHFCSNCGQDLTPASQKAKEAYAKVQKQAQQYQQALQAFSQGDLAQAQIGFAAAGDYSDAPAKLALVQKAQVQAKAQAQAEAVAQAEAAAARVREEAALAEAQKPESQYQKGVEAFGQGDLQTAQSAFLAAKDYSDAPAKLSLVRKALAQEAAEQKQAQAANYKKSYEDSLAAAAAVQTSAGLAPYIEYLQKLGSYEDAPQQLAKLLQRQAAMQVNEKKLAKHNKTIGYVVLVIVILLALGGGGGYLWYQHTQSQAQALAVSVTQQRKANAGSFNKLQSNEKDALKKMVAAYRGNVNDYVYHESLQTPDYTMITYTFKGPDKSKDILPAAGTRVYKQIAIYRH